MVNAGSSVHRSFPISVWPARGYSPSRLICLPWAGGTAAAFRSWTTAFGNTVQVLAMEMPGHGACYGERCAEDAYDLANILAEAIGSLPAPETPFLIYGHSMGAMLGFEVARILCARAAPLRGLVLTGYHAPHWLRTRAQRSLMSDVALLESLKQMGGTAPEIFESPELVSIFLPILRSDFRLTENYLPELEDLMPKLSLPVDIIGGREDSDNPVDGMQAWREVLAGPVEISLWPGGHFFIEEHRTKLVRHIGRRLEEWLKTAPNEQADVA